MKYPTYERNHFADIFTYEESVLTCERPACQWEKLAVERHIKDLDRQDDDDFLYYFDEQKALEPIHFVECFTHVKGKWASTSSFRDRLIELSPWQKWIFAVLFGWRKKSNGLRRFSLAYICVPRKNGKSVIAAGLSLFMLAADGEHGAEIYCGATNERQAWEVFRPAKKMVQAQPLFSAYHNVAVHAKKLERPTDGSRMEPIIGKPGDGASPSFWVADEYHEHPDDALVETMVTGQGAREHGLGLIITTAGDNHDGPCYLQEQELKDVLSGIAVDDSLFGIVYTIDKDVDWKSDKALEMANPNMGVSVGIDYLKNQQNKALISARRQNSFKNKHLDVWVSARDSWLNMENWAKAKTVIDWVDFLKQKAGYGADLSESDDLTALVKCFRKIIDGKDHYFFHGYYFTTEAKAQENKRYYEWIECNHLIECDGSMIDYELVEEYAGKDSGEYKVNRCFYDPKGAPVLAQRIEKELGITAVRFEQSYTNFSPIMKDFEALLLDGRIHHDGNPCLTWMVGNIIAKTTMDGKDIRPVKGAKSKKIDGGVAMLMAFANVYEIPDKTLSDHLEENGLRDL